MCVIALLSQNISEIMKAPSEEEIRIAVFKEILLSVVFVEVDVDVIVIESELLLALFFSLLLLRRELLVSLHCANLRIVSLVLTAVS